MPTYNISQIIGKTMYAVKTVQVYNLPYDNQQPIRLINAGQPIGTVYSFVLPRSGRSDSYFVFQNVYGQEFYVKYEKGNLRMTEGALTIKEAEAAKRDWLDKIADGFGVSDGTFARTAVKLGTGALIIWGSKVLLDGLKVFKR